MAANRKVSISTGPTNHRQSSSERHAAYVAQIANRQSELKREAAERRARREVADRDDAAATPDLSADSPPESDPGTP